MKELHRLLIDWRVAKARLKDRAATAGRGISAAEAFELSSAAVDAAHALNHWIDKHLPEWMEKAK